MKAEIINTNYSTRLLLFNPDGSRYNCFSCGEDQFTFIQSDYIVCLECGKQQPYELEWTDKGVRAAVKSD